MGLIYAFLSSIILSMTAQTDVPYSSVEKAFSSNNANEIVNLGKEKILMNVFGKEGAYSKSQAGLVLKDFFTKKPCNTFKFIFKSKESADGCFAIGNYESKNETYRVTIHFKKESGNFKIESLAIEK
jgi:hypothetical protein